MEVVVEGLVVNEWKRKLWLGGWRGGWAKQLTGYLPSMAVAPDLGKGGDGMVAA